MSDFTSILQKFFRRNDQKSDNPTPVLDVDDVDSEVGIGGVDDVWASTPLERDADKAVWAAATDENPVDEIVVDENPTADTAAAETINQRPELVITVLSGKGGVGKTSTILSLAGALLQQDKKVLFVDLDPQGSLSTAVLDDQSVETMAAAFDSKTIAELAVRSTWKQYKGKAFIAPANRALSKLDAGIEPKTFETELHERLGDLSEFDAIVVDAPATLGALTAEAVAIATDVVVVAEPSLYSLRAAADAVEFAEAVRKPKRAWRRNLKVVLNKLDETEESQYRAREIKQVLPGLVLKSTISQSEAIHSANGSGVPVQVLEGESAEKAAAEFAAVLAELAAK